MTENNDLSKNEETGRWNLIIGNYRISSDSYQWILYEVKQKQEDEGVYYNTLGYYSTMRSAFYSLREHKLSKIEIASIDNLMEKLELETDKLIKHSYKLEKKLESRS